MNPKKANIATTPCSSHSANNRQPPKMPVKEYKYFSNPQIDRVDQNDSMNKSQYKKFFLVDERLFFRDSVFRDLILEKDNKFTYNCKDLETNDEAELASIESYFLNNTKTRNDEIENTSKEKLESPLPKDIKSHKCEYGTNDHAKKELILLDGSLCLGELRNNKPYGIMEIKYLDGNIYKGTLNSNFKRHGKGEITTTDMMIIKGRFNNDIPSGTMEVTYLGKLLYEGTLNKDLVAVGNGRLYVKNDEKRIKDGKMLKKLK